MPQYLSAKEFRQRIPRIAEDLKRWREIIVLKKSKPIFKVIPFEGTPSDLLDRSASIQDLHKPDLQEIARIVHKIRGVD